MSELFGPDGRRLGGDGALNLPYESDPAPTRRGLAAGSLLAGGLICKAAAFTHPELGSDPLPALIFQFALPHGEMTPEIMLVVERHELEAAGRLVTQAVEGALGATA